MKSKVDKTDHKTEKYIPAKIEAKWQKKWKDENLYSFNKNGNSDYYYNLVELPYPSGDLHIGHWFTFVNADIHARRQRMAGKNVFFPNGFDAFGLPAENAAIKRGIHPQDWTRSNIESMKRQFDTMGTMIDWSHEAITCDPAYYRWNQWIFNRMFERGLAYRGKALSNWCPSCQTVLANEAIEEGKCWRCGSIVIQKEIEQWFLKITEFAEQLLWPEIKNKGSEGRSVDWPQSVRDGQNNWIGKSEGALVLFPVDKKYNFVLLHGFGGTPEVNFFPWLKDELEKKGHTVQIPELPNTNSPTEAEQVNFILDNIKFDDNTVLYGHSLGSVVAMKVVEKLKKPISALVLSGTFARPIFLDHERPFSDTFSWDFDSERVKENTGFIKVIHDVKDDAVPIEQAQAVADMLGVGLEKVTANASHFDAQQEPEILKRVIPSVEVFTTRPDTIFGATFVVIAPEHPILTGLSTHEVIGYINSSKKKTEIQRKEQKEKTGVFSGLYVTNPVNHEKLPIWVADYVLWGYGTGAIMAVPAHDDRDFEFAKKFGIPVRKVIQSTQTFQSLVLKRSVDQDSFRNEILKEGLNIEDYEEWGMVVKGGGEKAEIYIKILQKNIKEEFYADIDGAINAVIFKNKIFHLPQEDEAAREYGKKVGVPDEQLDWQTEKTYAYNFSERGKLVNSGKYSGLGFEEFVTALLKDFPLFVNKTVTYHLHDWSVSRQRYWGTPVPMIHCPKCGVMPVPDKDLPVELPYEVDYTPKGKPPLATATKWMRVDCPKCGGEAKRDPETLDTFFDSSWYFYRYLDPGYTKGPFDKLKASSLMPVDIYFGGAEHTLGHTLYARFFTKFFKDLGLVTFDEFAKKRVQHGVILGPDGFRMSKSRGNVVNPDEVAGEYGTDAVRIYLAFMMPFDGVSPWSTGAISGIYRFLQRVWQLLEKVKISSVNSSEEDLYQMHKTIKKVGEDIDLIKFNTAVASLMEWLNYLSRKDKVSEKEYSTFLLLLAPLAPHMTEELWERLRVSKVSKGTLDTSDTFKSIHVQAWPSYDPEHLKREVVTIVIQVNGKLRDSIDMPNDASEESVKQVALEREKVAKFISKNSIKRAIYIPGKLLNLVV